MVQLCRFLTWVFETIVTDRSMLSSIDAARRFGSSEDHNLRNIPFFQHISLLYIWLCGLCKKHYEFWEASIRVRATCGSFLNSCMVRSTSSCGLTGEVVSVHGNNSLLGSLGEGGCCFFLKSFWGQRESLGWACQVRIAKGFGFLPGQKLL